MDSDVCNEEGVLIWRARRRIICRAREAMRVDSEGKVSMGGLGQWGDDGTLGQEVFETQNRLQ